MVTRGTRQGRRQIRIAFLQAGPAGEDQMRRGRQRTADNARHHDGQRQGPHLKAAERLELRCQRLRIRE